MPIIWLILEKNLSQINLKHGPVSRKVYNSLSDKSILYSDIEYEDNGDNPDNDFHNLTSDQQDFITDILDQLHSWTGMELERATHQEKPWIEARIGYSEADKCNIEISKEITKDYYKKDLNV